MSLFRERSTQSRGVLAAILRETILGMFREIGPGTARLLLVLGAICGCDEAPRAPALPATDFGNATVTGRVRFIVTPPERAMIDVSSCQAGTKAYQEETIIVGEGGALKDVVVYLKDQPTTDGQAQPTAVLDQIDCRYVPHVVAVQVNQPLKITSSDTCFHNVHLRGTNTDEQNYNFPRAGVVETVRFSNAGSVRAACNVHPWMNASIFVTGSPFFGVSSRDGRFVIARVPAGRHTVAAWHPILGERTSSVEVAADGTVERDIDFAPP